MSLSSSQVHLFGGNRMNPFSPRVEDIDIRDIAHALSQICRFNGHTKNFLSVAEHSVFVSHRVPPEFALWGLLHDASEAYLGDVVRPLKYTRMYGDYRDAESRLMAAVCQKFGLPIGQPAAVAAADTMACETEGRALVSSWERSGKAFSYVPPCWDPVTAETQFLEHFNAYRRPSNGGSL